MNDKDGVHNSVNAHIYTIYNVFLLKTKNLKNKSPEILKPHSRAIYVA